MIPLEKTYAINRLLNKLDDATSALAHAEKEMAEAKKRYETIKEEIRKAILAGAAEELKDTKD